MKNLLFILTFLIPLVAFSEEIRPNIKNGASGLWTIDAEMTRNHLKRSQDNDDSQFLQDFEEFVEVGLPIWSVSENTINHEKGAFPEFTNLDYKILSNKNSHYYLAIGPSQATIENIGIVVGKIIHFSEDNIHIGLTRSWREEDNSDFEFILFLHRIDE